MATVKDLTEDLPSKVSADTESWLLSKQPSLLGHVSASQKSHPLPKGDHKQYTKVKEVTLFSVSYVYHVTAAVRYNNYYCQNIVK